MGDTEIDRFEDVDREYFDETGGKNAEGADGAGRERAEGTAMIECGDVAKHYAVGGGRVIALGGVTLRIDRGEFVCVTGRSGSGKSTLLHLMAGLEPPTRGAIRVAGKRIERLGEAALVEFRLRNVGFIFQSFNLFAAHTALHNVAMPLMYRGVPRAARLRRAMAALTLVGLSSRAGHRPGELSGGQQQRVGIARALVAKPKLVFADEPTGNLDLRTSREIMDLIRNACRESGATLVVVTHDREVAGYADREIELSDGRIVGG